MTQTTAAQTVTPNGAGHQLAPPQAGMAGVSALVLDNLSTFLLTVSVGGNTYYHAPLVEARYDLASSNGNVSVAAAALPGDVATSGIVAPTWYLQGETPPAAAYPIALSGPAEVAAATAAALLQTGVPNVLIETPVYNAVVLRNSQTTAIDVSGFASLQISITPQNGPLQNLMSYFYSNDGTTQLEGDYLGSGFQFVPVRSRYLVLVNSAATTDVLVEIDGTNRAMPTMHDRSAAAFTNAPAQFAMALQAVVAGTSYQLANTHANQFQQPSGRCFLAVSLSSGTAARGIINLAYLAGDGTSQTYPLMDTGEMHLDNPSGALFGYKEVILPANVQTAGNSIQFQCRVAGSTAVTVTIVQDPA